MRKKVEIVCINIFKEEKHQEKFIELFKKLLMSDTR